MFHKIPYTNNNHMEIYCLFIHIYLTRIKYRYSMNLFRFKHSNFIQKYITHPSFFTQCKQSFHEWFIQINFSNSNYLSMISLPNQSEAFPRLFKIFLKADHKFNYQLHYYEQCYKSENFANDPNIVMHRRSSSRAVVSGSPSDKFPYSAKMS